MTHIENGAADLLTAIHGEDAGALFSLLSDKEFNTFFPCFR